MTSAVVHPCTTKTDHAVVIETTIKALYDDGTRSFFATHIARDIRKKTGVKITGVVVGKYLSSHPCFIPDGVNNNGVRWKVVRKL